MAANNTGDINLPRIASDAIELVYNIHTDAPDGWVSAHVSPFVESDASYGVGLWHPWRLTEAGTGVTAIQSQYGSVDARHKTTCYMYNAETTAGFYPVEASQTYQALSGNTYNLSLIHI